MPKSKTRRNQWTFLDREFLSTPSVKESGMDLKEEILLRFKACKIIERVGKELNLPLDQINIGKILLHRFYMRKSFKKAEYHEVAATILFIAGKLGSGGNFVSLEKVIHYIVRDCCKDPVKRASLNTKEGSKHPHYFSQDYNYWSAAIFYYEDIILEALCFEDHAQVPHTIALDLIREFNGSKLLQHTAFLYCNDSLCTTLAVRYSPQTIAYAAIYAAVEACGQQLMNINETQWWVTMGLNQNHLKVLAMEISIASDPLALASLSEKISQKLSSDSSPMGVPNTPSLFESSPISNAETACNVPIGGNQYDSLKTKHTSIQTPAPATVVSFF